MTDRPILFSAPMVRALLDGSKTQTRRAIKAPDSVTSFKHWDGARWDRMQGAGRGDSVNCPYGQPGDRLWVKETHWRDDENGEILYAADPADFEIVDMNKRDTGRSRYNWKPSIFMPRAASRITLEITAVRVERLQDISRGDAMAEGCPFPNMAHGDDPRKWYAELWESINGPGSWAENPFVWVVSFRRIGL